MDANAQPNLNHLDLTDTRMHGCVSAFVLRTLYGPPAVPHQTSTSNSMLEAGEERRCWRGADTLSLSSLVLLLQGASRGVRAIVRAKGSELFVSWGWGECLRNDRRCAQRVGVGRCLLAVTEAARRPVHRACKCG